MSIKVDISAQTINFPPICACCGGPPDAVVGATATRTTGVRVVRQTSQGWDFPYCTRCIAHVTALHKARGVQTALIIAGALLSLVVGMAVGNFGLTCILALIFCGAAILIGRILIKNAEATKGANCANCDGAVRYNGWHGSCHFFVLDSPHYAYHFMHANINKLVNVHPQTHQWLHGQAPPVGQQTVQRYIS